MDYSIIQEIRDCIIVAVRCQIVVNQMEENLSTHNLKVHVVQYIQNISYHLFFIQLLSDYFPAPKCTICKTQKMHLLQRKLFCQIMSKLERGNRLLNQFIHFCLRSRSSWKKNYCNT